MFKVMSGNFTRHHRILMFGVLFLFILSVLLQWYSYDVGTMVLENITLPLLVFAIGMIYAHNLFATKIEFQLGIAFILWFVITRILNGDHYLLDGKFKLVVIIGAIGLALPFYSIAGEQRRNALLSIISILFVGFSLVIAWLSIYSAITNTPLSLPSATSAIEINQEFRLAVFNKHPNLLGCTFGVCLLITLYFYSYSKHKKLLLFPLILVSVSLFCAVTLTVSRTAMINLALFLSLSLIIAISGKISFKSQALKRLSLLFIALIAGIAIYMSYGFVRNVVMELSKASSTSQVIGSVEPNSTSTQQENNPALSVELAPADSSPQVPATSQQATVIANRDSFDDAATLNGRVGIYVAVIKGMFDNPKAFLLGSSDASALKEANKYLLSPVSHTHNSFLQVLSTMGILGLAICILFSFRLAKDSFILFRSRDADVSDRILTLIPAMIFIHGMLEPFVFYCFDLINVIFFLFAGVIIAKARFERDKSQI